MGDGGPGTGDGGLQAENTAFIGRGRALMDADFNKSNRTSQATNVDLKHKDVTDKILYAFFKIVYPQLGYGFMEKVYENAMLIALQSMGLKVQQQEKIAVYFQGQVVGEYFVARCLTMSAKQSPGCERIKK